jgi:hypothetical protein
MDRAVARTIAQDSHAGQRDRIGEPLIDHVSRVAAAVPPTAQTTAWLHDLLERTGVDVEVLAARGLTTLERTALDLLTRGADESFEAYVLRIAHAGGAAGDLARTVKVADLLDHISREQKGRMAADAPPYRWALRHVDLGPALGFVPPIPVSTSAAVQLESSGSSSASTS